MSTDGRDYHTEMNSNLFEKWIKDQLLWALPKNSIIIMDNASYGKMEQKPQLLIRRKVKSK
jgi:hypothetical protein